MKQQVGQFDIYGNVPKVPEAKPKTAMAAAFSKMDDNGIVELGVYNRVAKFKNNSITRVDVWKPYVDRPANPNRNDNLLNQNGNGNHYNGYLSPATRRYVEQLLSVWLTSVELSNDLKKKAKEHNRAEVFPTFVTLTLPSPQMHSDNTIKAELLNPFIKWLQGDETIMYQRGKRKGQQKGFGVKAYFWRAEPQKNTRIHFHLIVDRYVHWERIREKWNECCERLGYVTRFGYMQKAREARGFELDESKVLEDMEILKSLAEVALADRKMPLNVHPVFESYLKISVNFGRELSVEMLRQAAVEKQEKAFEEGVKTGWSNPNSTDIHSIRSLESVTAYVIKYIAKKPEELPLADNQKVEFNEQFNRNMIHTYDYVTDWDGTIRPEIVDIQENIPVFKERKINGRIWGCADLLRGYKPDAETDLETDENGCTYAIRTVEQEGQEPTVVKRPVAIMKYYTRTIGYFERFMLRSGKEIRFVHSDYQLIDPVCEKYLADITNAVGVDTVKAVSSKVGESFARMNGEIIPFRPEKMGYKSKGKDKNGKPKPIIVKHADVLKKFSPELHRDYVNYYKHIYNCIYSAAA